MEITLLLVDDHPLFRQGLHLLLEKQGDLRVVGEAGDGQTAIELVRERSPDVVVMDITMPELDGIEATRRILAESVGTKVIALSIHAEKRFVEDMLRAGASGYILKESVPEELINGIRTVTGGEVYLSAAITQVVVSHYMSLLTGDQTPSDDEEPEELPSTAGDQATATAVITTKLHRPPPTPDLVYRPRLLERLDLYRQRPLTLISAGAGYGKSTLVSHWLETADCPGAWLALDERDDDLVSFLTHFIAAIRTILPETGQKTLALVQAPTPPPLRSLCANLANELDQIETPFILVLDDYHHIRELAIQDLLNELLRYPPHPMHLVIVTRRDPLLALTNLRARGQVTEIGDQELRFTVAETAAFLQRFTQSPVDEAAAAIMEKKTEGWPAGLRLLALSLRHRGDLDRLLRSLPENIHHVVDYLMAEVVSHQSPAVQDFLLKTAILERFCAPLADALLGKDAQEQGSRGAEEQGRWGAEEQRSRGAEEQGRWGAEEQRSRGAEEQGRWGAEEQRSRGAEEQGRKGEAGITSAPLPPRSPAPPPPRPSAPPPPRPSASGQTILEQLQRENLFIIPLDDQRVWFRYHHLFQELLLQRLNQTQGPESIAALHRRASEWFAENNLIDEALQHALAANDISYAVHLVEQHRYSLMNTEQWQRLERWLKMLPPETVEKNPILLITQAYLYEYRGQIVEAFAYRDQAEGLLSTLQPESPEGRAVRGEITVLYGEQYILSGEGDRAIESAERALRLIPPEALHIWSYAIGEQVLANQIAGDIGRGLTIINELLNEHALLPGISEARMMLWFCLAYWMEGDLNRLKQPALRCLKLGEQHALPESISFGRYFLGAHHYVRNELAEAERYLAAVVDDPHTARPNYFAQSAFALALIHTAQGRDEDASNVLESVISHTMGTNDTLALAIARAFQVELALRQGKVLEAQRLSERATYDLLPPIWFFYVPQLTPVKLMVAQNTPQSLEKALNNLDELDVYLRKTNRKTIRIDVLALQALILDAQGKESASFEKLTESLTLAEPGGFIRNLVDLGPPVADLLTRLKHQGVAPDYIDRILTAFPDFGFESKVPTPIQNPKSKIQNLVEPLTPRELDVLKLLAQQLSNKEIAQELVISPETVKKHTARIYQKLGVNSRWEAVAKANTLGILSDG